VIEERLQRSQRLVSSVPSLMLESIGVLHVQSGGSSDRVAIWCRLRKGVEDLLPGSVMRIRLWTRDC